MVKVYLNKYLAGQQNKTCLDNLHSGFVVIKAQDFNKDKEKNTCSISIPDNIGFSQTANLPEKLKLCVGTRVMLTDNISASDKLINGTVDAVNHFDRRSKPFCSTIDLKFDYPKAGNCLKDRRRQGELKECVPITARAKKFALKKKKVLSLLKKKKFPLILGHAVTVHKYQGSTLAYMQGDLNQSTDNKTVTRKNY